MNPVSSVALANGYAALMRVNAVQMARAPVSQTGVMTATAPAAVSMSLQPDPALRPTPPSGTGRGTMIDIEA